jgi:hypothetical protein
MALFIEANDPKAIILLVADHGNCVGYNYTGAAYKQLEENRLLKRSVFSALFTVKAPKYFGPYRKTVPSTIGIFPALFDYLSGTSIRDCKSFDNSSYLLITTDVKKELYRCFESYGILLLRK